MTFETCPALLSPFKGEGSAGRIEIMTSNTFIVDS